jgi:hypothetical protein
MNELFDVWFLFNMAMSNEWMNEWKLTTWAWVMNEQMNENWTQNIFSTNKANKEQEVHTLWIYTSVGWSPPVWLVRIVQFQFWLSETELELGLILDPILELEPESVGGQIYI